MNYYQELLLLPQEEIPIHFLWSKTFQQIHLGLVEIQSDKKRVPIGISFPEYAYGEKLGVLGSKLRLFASDEVALMRFNIDKWLIHLSDYVHCTSIRPIPNTIKGYAVYCREQPKTGRERLARRYARRHSLDYEAALNGKVELSVKPEERMEHKKVLMSYSEMPHKIIATPFIRLKSLSSGRMFCLWIKKTAVSEFSSGTFSSYGLSTFATVPDF